MAMEFRSNENLFWPWSLKVKSLPGWGKLALMTNIHQQTCILFGEECPWAWAIDLQVAKDMKERVSATSLLPKVFLWHSESCGYKLRMTSPFCSLYPTFRVYQFSAHSLISESSQSQNFQILFYSMQPDLNLEPVTSAAHSLSLETLSWSQILLKTIHRSIQFTYSAYFYGLPFFPFFFPSFLCEVFQLRSSFYKLSSSSHFPSQLACPVCQLPFALPCLSNALSLRETSLSPNISFSTFMPITPRSSLPQTYSPCLGFTSLILPQWHLAALSY